ncbi:hypothetical protein [Pseudomonas grimontii]|uniref:hypothetical protein n=1 Tax=Pseudomonas grimontii TaxID=129847 RepID=UPI00216A31AF|nr:putative ubiquitin-like protein YukD [Pseudomonas grimontii]
MDYPKSVPNVGLVGGKFVDENTSTGQVGSLIPSAWGTAVTDEIINVIKAADIDPKENENNQLSVAIKEIIKKNAAPKGTKLSDYGITDGITSEQMSTALAGKANKASTMSGYGITDGINAVQLNAGLAQKWDLATYPPSQYIKMGQAIPSGSNPVFHSTGFGAIAAIPGGAGALQVSGGDAPSSAVICFHRPGSYGVMFGLDTDNQLKLGGWSAGTVAHTIWHSGNRPKDTALLAPSGWSKNADTGEIKQWVEVLVDDISSFKLLSVSWPFQFPNSFLNAQITFRIPLASNVGCVTVGSYHSATTSGCTIRVEEYAAVYQNGMVAIIEARGY